MITSRSKIVLSLFAVFLFGGCSAPQSERNPSPPTSVSSAVGTSSASVDRQADKNSTTPSIQQDSAQPSCEDSDGGENLSAKGVVIFSYSQTIREGAALTVLDAGSAVFRLGGEREVHVNDSFPITEKDQVFYSEVDGNQGQVMVDRTSQITIRKIVFKGQSNSDNQIEVQSNETAEDVCVGNVLVEYSCDRGLNNGHLCPHGCKEGVCLP